MSIVTFGLSAYFADKIKQSMTELAENNDQSTIDSKDASKLVIRGAWLNIALCIFKPTFLIVNFIVNLILQQNVEAELNAGSSIYTVPHSYDDAEMTYTTLAWYGASLLKNYDFAIEQLFNNMLSMLLSSNLLLFVHCL